MSALPAGLRQPGPTTFGTWVKLPSLETLELAVSASTLTTQEEEVG